MAYRLVLSIQLSGVHDAFCDFMLWDGHELDTDVVFEERLIWTLGLSRPVL